MLLTKQQKFLLDALGRLGCVREDQLARLIQPVFCTEKPEIAQRLVHSAMRQMKYGNCGFRQEGNVFLYRNAGVDPQLLDAIDVMLDLGDFALAAYYKPPKPVLLRFIVQGEKVRSFSIVQNGADMRGVELDRTERVIQLFDGRGQPSNLAVSNKTFYAMRQKDGRFRFVVRNGKTT